MKLNRTTLIPTMPDSADIAYLLLIFIIIMSIIGTDNISGLKLPKSSAEEPATRQAVRIVVSETSFIVDQTEYANVTELESVLQSVPADNGVIIVADKDCRCSRIKTVLAALERIGLNKTAFMTE